MVCLASSRGVARIAEIAAHANSLDPPLNVAKTRKLLASFGAADQITPAHMDELLVLCTKEMYMMPLFEHLHVPQYCLKVFAAHRNEAVRECALFALSEFWQNNNTRSKVMASLDVLPFVFSSVLDDPKKFRRRAHSCLSTLTFSPCSRHTARSIRWRSPVSCLCSLTILSCFEIAARLKGWRCCGSLACAASRRWSSAFML